MIVVCNKPGQLGNRLIVFASLIAIAKEYSLTIINPSFDEYADYFEGSQNLIVKYPRTESIARGKFGKTFRRLLFNFSYYAFAVIIRIGVKGRFLKTIALEGEEELDIEESYILMKSQKKLVLLNGWKFRGNNLLKKNKSEIIKYFTPEKFYSQRIDAYVQKLEKVDYSILVGIHIRRGDYFTFENGIYYYSDNQYLDQMKRIQHLFKNEKIHFILFSNESLNLDFFNKEDISAQLGPGFELDDMYILSKCHFIAGPPSTYTMWASFYGEKPLYMIKNLDNLFELKDFRIIDEF
ncbi:MAG: alpha-1,2-fucosyltransferase [Sporocytophaga sp.]|uniref:alpha-1,2-fucosyltransferase n=1 Tax=Sporocytophaga sp. TaxID=2231183 RepID=UPI001B1B88CE|nr:alpha-1,2-fucosyltransferase [Sporocytophaga sp.]MBO9701645.1 alpha-1,2-fucosyltransferase [Sporocytophaga sp.]